MHRRQPFDVSPRSVAVAEYSAALHGVFRRAVGYALASALGVSGCYGSARPISSEPSPNGAAGVGQDEQLGEQLPTAGRGGGAVESGGAGGVGGQEPPPAPDPRPTPLAPSCVNGFPQLFAGLTAEPFDAAEFRVQAFTTEGPQIWFTHGVLCSTASDPPACQAQVAAVSDKSTLPFTDSMPMFGMVTRYVVTTLGDEVRKYQSREELVQFLGSIDSPEDALLLLYYDYRSVLCDPAQLASSFTGVDPSSIVEVDDGYQAVFVAQTFGCNGITGERARLHVARDGTVTETERAAIVSGAPAGCAGRRPEGLRSQHRSASAPALGEHFARMAHLEAASVVAFELLASELAAHGAPDELIAWARRAAADEVRHAATTRELARRFGARPIMPDIASTPPRSLEALAIENAREGCVRECFGAALGCYQAQAATDPAIAVAMAAIADDETQHAALAFAIDAWVQTRLDAPARARVAAARAQAVSTLRAELACSTDVAARAALGLPDDLAALRLHSALEQALWAA